MNRIIKFRGMRTAGKGWVYGSYICFKGESNIRTHFDVSDKRDHKYRNITLDKHLIAECLMPDEQGWDYGSQIKFYEVVPESVGQFTGLLDKNGTEIYEGDICSGHSGGNGVITWTDFDGGYDYIFDDEGNIGIWEVMKDIMVAGNIHEKTETK